MGIYYYSMDYRSPKSLGTKGTGHFSRTLSLIYLHNTSIGFFEKFANHSRA